MTKKWILFALLLFSLSIAVPFRNVQSLGSVTPPADMFQWPWPQGESWVAYDGFDNGFKRSLGSPHNFLNGGAIDFAPHANMHVGENTSNFWVAAAAAGTVSKTSSCHVVIDHGNGWTTEYWHLDWIQVQVGTKVSRNQRLGIIADNINKQVCTGNEFPGPHVHFLMRPNFIDTIFSGWTIHYNMFTNKTTFTKVGQTLGSFQPISNVPNLQIVLREPLVWDVPGQGTVDAYRYERWPLQLTDATNFDVTTSATSAGLTPWIVLLNASGAEITRAVGTLSSSQPAGSYFVQIQPVAGFGFYTVTARKKQTPVILDPYVITSADRSSIAVGESALMKVDLINVPSAGYSGVEFTCTYDATVAAASSIGEVGLFGTDAVTAVNGPQNGSFISALVGSNGQRATASGTAFTFNLRALRSGQTAVDCTARVSQGSGTLTTILHFGTNLSVIGGSPTVIP